MGRLNVDWYQLPIDSRRSLLRALSRTSRTSLNAMGLTMTIHGLGKMNVDITYVPVELRNNLMYTLIR